MAVRIDPIPIDPLGGGGPGKLGGGAPAQDVYVWKTTMQLWDGFNSTPIMNGRGSATADGNFGSIEASGVGWSDANGNISITRILTQAEYDAVATTTLKVTAAGYKMFQQTRAVTVSTVGNVHTKSTTWGKVYLARSAN